MADTVMQWLGTYLASDHVDWKQVVLIGMTPVFLMAFAVEWQVMRGRGRRAQFHWQDIFANLNLGGAYQLFEIAAHLTVTAAAVGWIHQQRLFDIPVTAWTVLPIMLGVEFCYYWFHRLSHRVRWFWSAHVVHHSGEHMNMTTAMRQSLLYSITGWWLFFMPLVLLGVSPAAVFFLYAVNLSYQFFIHTESVGKLHPVLEYLLNTPSNHRVHHGRNAQYIDKNYGGILIVFDRWFGTYEAEVEAPDYGIATRQPKGYNLLVLNFHEFLDMWRDVLRPGPLATRLKHLWAPPEWERPTAETLAVIPPASEPSPTAVSP
ncbi:sterol desaturase family protein [Oleomonas cavernae]|uniref:Sterol desaturase family protein n=1 Tax=Oleomonas cavernae TaxID=2320859 RepID=A0A418WBP9_9PROT|nr:sterol desaturase family protein [Oleomonas cavernae]RJF87430.1 sterol desaturase family protein [Oleomonas cavernae]